MLYTAKWQNSVWNGTETGIVSNALKSSQFSKIWKTFLKKPFALEGHVYTLKIRKPRTGFTCKTCTLLRKQRRDARTKLAKEEVAYTLRLHLQQSREAREVYSDHIYASTTNNSIASWAMDAADQVICYAFT